MRLKDSSVVFDAKAPLLYALWRIEIVMQNLGDVVITSQKDGTHKPRSGRISLHYSGLAVDIRSKHLTPEQKQRVKVKLRDSLGVDYDVVLEAEGMTNEHFHIEYDPKVRTA